MLSDKQFERSFSPTTMGVRREGKTGISPLEIGTKTKKIIENLVGSYVPIKLI